MDPLKRKELVRELDRKILHDVSQYVVVGWSLDLPGLEGGTEGLERLRPLLLHEVRYAREDVDRQGLSHSYIS